MNKVRYTKSHLLTTRVCTQVRTAAAAAAAALIEGPRQRAYLAMAEHHEGATLR